MGGMAVGTLVWALGAVPASAQATIRKSPPPQAKPQKPKGDPKWTLTVHGGMGMGATPSGGSAGQFPVGSTFNTDAGFQSRATSSWFFGDGAALFNEVRGQFASRFNVSIPSITPLDSTLTSSALSRKGGPAFGFRLGRSITKRFGIEFGFDRSNASLELSGGARSAIEASRSTFESGFRGLINTIPQAGLSVTSTADIGDADGVQTIVTGALTIGLVNSGRLAVHALAGGGYVSSAVDSLDVRLRGNYQFRLFDTFAFNETDTVTIRLSESESSPAGLVGGGFTYSLGKRHGLRADVRALIGSNGITTVIDATPSTATSAPSVALPSNTNPTIQFSNLANVRSSLGGATTNLRTFTGSGLDTRLLFTVGYLLRF